MAICMHRVVIMCTYIKCTFYINALSIFRCLVLPVSVYILNVKRALLVSLSYTSYDIKHHFDLCTQIYIIKSTLRNVIIKSSFLPFLPLIHGGQIIWPTRKF